MNMMKNIVNEFIEIINNFRKDGIIKPNDLMKYTESNLHSWLQYALMKAGEKLGLFSIPECKLRFSKPIDPSDYGITRKRKRHFSKVDIAFYDKNKKLLGISEVFTIDEAHGALPSAKLAEVGHYWLTPRDSLMHLIQYALPRPKFIVLVSTLLKKAPYIPWKTKIKEIDSKLESSKNYYEVFRPYWVELKKQIVSQNVKVSLLIINEDGVEKA